MLNRVTILSPPPKLHFHMYLIISTSFCRRTNRLSIKGENFSKYRKLKVQGSNNPPPPSCAVSWQGRDEGVPKGVPVHPRVDRAPCACTSEGWRGTMCMSFHLVETLRDKVTWKLESTIICPLLDLASEHAFWWFPFLASLGCLVFCRHYTRLLPTSSPFSTPLRFVVHFLC